MNDSTLEPKKRKNKLRAAKKTVNSLDQAFKEKFQETVSECLSEHPTKGPDTCEMNSARKHRKMNADGKSDIDSNEVMKVDKIGSTRSIKRNQRKKKGQNKGQVTQMKQTTEIHEAVAEDPCPPSVQYSGNEAMNKITSEDGLTMHGNHNTQTEIKTQNSQPIVPVFKERKTQSSRIQSGRQEVEEVKSQRSDAGPMLSMDVDNSDQITPRLDEMTHEHLQTVPTHPSLLEVIKDMSETKCTEAQTTSPDNIRQVQPLKVIVEEWMIRYNINTVPDVSTALLQKSEIQEKNDHSGLQTNDNISVTNETESNKFSEQGAVFNQGPNNFRLTLNPQLRKTFNSGQDEKMSTSVSISDKDGNLNESISTVEIKIPSNDEFQISETEKHTSENYTAENTEQALHVPENKQNGKEKLVIHRKESTCEPSLESKESLEKQKDDNPDQPMHTSDESLADISVVQSTGHEPQQCDEVLNLPTQEIVFCEYTEDGLEIDCNTKDTMCKTGLLEFHPDSRENLNDKEKEAENEFLMDPVHSIVENQRMTEALRNVDQSVSTKDVNMEVVEIDDYQAKNDSVVDDLSDSQLRAMEEEFVEEMDYQNHNKRYNQKTPIEPPPLDGTTIVQGIIRELSQLNSFVLKKKREMDAAKRQSAKSKWNLQSAISDDQPSLQWSSHT